MLLTDPRVPLWGVAEQPYFSLGEYARRLKELRAGRDPERQRAPQFANIPLPPLPAAPTPGPVRGLLPPSFARRRASVRPRNRWEERLTSDPIRVRRGDSMWNLSRIYLGAGKLWVQLWKANPEVRNPHLIHPGQVLRWPEIPAVARNAVQGMEDVHVFAGVHAPGGVSVVHQEDVKIESSGSVVASDRQWAEKDRRSASGSSASAATGDAIRGRRGDSMWNLSRSYLGAGKLWVHLWKANPEVRDPNLIYPGQWLRWPDPLTLACSERPATSRTKLAAAVGSRVNPPVIRPAMSVKHDEDEPAVPNALLLSARRPPPNLR